MSKSKYEHRMNICHIILRTVIFWKQETNKPMQCRMMPCMRAKSSFCLVKLIILLDPREGSLPKSDTGWWFGPFVIFSICSIHLGIS